jgi:SAM-dependent methyltransferase
MDFIIFKEIAKNISFKDKDTIELGCGRGVLSKLILENCAIKVTLVDFSKEAIRLAHDLIGDKKAQFIEAEILELPEVTKYDIVFSSGVAEHFSGEFRKNIILKHLALSRDKVVLVVPARPHFNTIRHRKQRTINLYGWQHAFDKNEIKVLVSQNNVFKIIVIKRFYCLYGINTFELFGIDSRSLFARCWNFCCRAFDHLIELTRIKSLIDMILKPLDDHFGGLLIAVAEKIETKDVTTDK